MIKRWYTHHFHNLGVDGLTENAPGCSNVVNQLVETCSFYFFTLEIRDRVHEVEYNAALQQLVDKQVLLLRRWCVCNQWHPYKFVVCSENAQNNGIKYYKFWCFHNLQLSFLYSHLYSLQTAAIQKWETIETNTQLQQKSHPQAAKTYTKQKAKLCLFYPETSLGRVDPRDRSNGSSILNQWNPTQIFRPVWPRTN